MTDEGRPEFPRRARQRIPLRAASERASKLNRTTLPSPSLPRSFPLSAVEVFVTMTQSFRGASSRVLRKTGPSP